jgi:very-short-patch-repair endonuclease
MYYPTRDTGATPVKIERARELRRTMTPEERLLWRALRPLRAQGYPFRRQQIIAGFIVDFYCHRARLVVEVDGGIHHQQAVYDAERDHVLRAHELRVLRVANNEVRQHLDMVLERIMTACALGSSPTGPLSVRGEGESSAGAGPSGG